MLLLSAGPYPLPEMRQEGMNGQGKRLGIGEGIKLAKDNFLHDGIALGLAEDDSFNLDSFSPLQMVC